MRYYRPVLLLLLPVFFLMSCRSLAPNRMFQTEKEYPYAQDTSAIRDRKFVIGPGDRIEFYLFSNDGFKLVDITGSSIQGGESARINYLVEEDSTIRLPIVGKIAVAGLTIAEAEKMLESIFTKYYRDPYILLKIVNRYAIVFQGDGGDGHLVSLQNDNTTLLEALALGGGIPDLGKAYEIKIIRGDHRNPQVFHVDLSTLEGLKQSPIRVQSNDIIYVESVPNYRNRFLSQLSPIVGILSAVVLLVMYTQR
jgi:polysaccharide export outer membrane protein